MHMLFIFFQYIYSEFHFGQKPAGPKVHPARTVAVANLEGMNEHMYIDIFFEIKL